MDRTRHRQWHAPDTRTSRLTHTSMTSRRYYGRYYMHTDNSRSMPPPRHLAITNTGGLSLQLHPSLDPSQIASICRETRAVRSRGWPNVFASSSSFRVPQLNTGWRIVGAFVVHQYALQITATPMSSPRLACGCPPPCSPRPHRKECHASFRHVVRPVVRPGGRPVRGSAKRSMSMMYALMDHGSAV